jgi:hypothetical protein
LKFVTSFKGDKGEVLAFVANVDTAFEVIDTTKADTVSPESGKVGGTESVLEKYVFRKEEARLLRHSAVYRKAE